MLCCRFLQAFKVSFLDKINKSRRFYQCVPPRVNSSLAPPAEFRLVRHMDSKAKKENF